MKRAFNDAVKRDAKIDTGRLLKIGEVARLSGIGIETLRFYEKSGLLDRPGRAYSNQRRRRAGNRAQARRDCAG